LIDKFKLTFYRRMDSQFIIFASRYQQTLVRYERGTFGGVGFKDEAQLSSLIPAMNVAVSTPTVAKTFFIESCAIKFGLWILLPKSSVFKKFLCSISWVPKLKRSCCYSRKSNIIGFL
jgi:hypothetical protein